MDKNEGEFSDEVVWAVWNKGYVETVSDAQVWRKDECGAWIRRADYRSRDSQHGWVIDQITPDSEGGATGVANLRPLQWQNVARGKDGRLLCPIVSSGTNNVPRPTSA